MRRCSGGNVGGRELAQVGINENRSNDGLPFTTKGIVVDFEGLELGQMAQPGWEGHQSIAADWNQHSSNV